ncbi:hypothetical protein JTB14_027058 [Gonioctena quinquepunctata]|nr:hypothetical protein JTB14_027058 [Gonioctena quinquepunctata]
MDLLQTILRSCECEEFYNNFKNNGIDSFTLKILDDEDLQIIGIQDVEKREKVLRHINNLQIPSEKKINTLVDKQYTKLVLIQMSEQLHRHLAVLTYALKRPDTDICDVKLSPALKCLQGVIGSLEKEIDSFECKVLKKNKRSRTSFIVIFPGFTLATLALYFCRNLYYK